MKKEEFLQELEKRLKGLPKDEIDERVSFYSEMVDDHMEEGKTEDEAIAEIGGTDEVVKRILDETPLVHIVKEKIKPKRSLTGLEIILLILGFPLWLPLLIVLGVFIMVTFILLWVLVIVTYSSEIALAGAGVAGFIRFFAGMGDGINVGYLGIGILGIGLAMIFVLFCVGATKVSFKITASFLLSIKKSLIGGKDNA